MTAVVVGNLLDGEITLNRTGLADVAALDLAHRIQAKDAAAYPRASVCGAIQHVDGACSLQEG